MARVFMLFLFPVLLYLVIADHIVKSDGRGIIGLYCMCAAMVFLLTNIVLSLIGIIKVEINETSDQITLYRFFSKKTILISEIISYSISVSQNRGGTVSGRVIETKDYKVVELSSINLQDVSDIDEVLKKHRIKYLGEKRSFYPFAAGL